MGGTLTMVPDNYIPSLTRGWAITGGGTLVTAVNDANDGTYITDSAPSGAGPTRISWHFANASLPTGAAIKYTYGVCRNSQAAGTGKLHFSIGSYNPPDGISYQSPATVWTPVPAITNTSCAAAGTVPQSRSQGVVNILFCSVLQYPSGAVIEDHRLYRMEAKVVYVDSPTAGDLSLSPTSANTLTTRPGFTWSFNSLDGFVQYEYRVALWKLTDINLHSGGRAGFEAAIADIFDNATFTGTDALPHSPIWRTRNDGDTSTWRVGSENTVTPDVDLDGSSQYVYYVQVSALHSGERLAHPTSMGILDFTQAITVPAQPTAITPTWQRDFQFRTQVQVTVPAATLGSWTGRKVYVERRIVGTSVDAWSVLPIGVQEVGAGAATWTFWDTLPAVNRTLEYRTRAVFWSSLGYTATSTYRTSTSIVADFVGFVLRDPLTADSAVVFRILGDFEANQEEGQGKFQPLASQYPVIVSDAIRGRSWSVEVRVKDLITEQFIDALRAKQSPLVLHTDMTNVWYWVRIGPTIRKRTIRQSDRRDETKREAVWSMELYEVNAIPGQPQTYF